MSYTIAAVNEAIRLDFLTAVADLGDTLVPIAFVGVGISATLLVVRRGWGLLKGFSK